MARPLRIEYEGALYHVTARGNERREIYRSDDDYHLFLEVLTRVVKETDWICHAYCLMPNHYHLLIETPLPNLSKGMRELNGVYTQRFNRRHKRSGHLFQGRHKAILVEKEAHLLELCRYVVLNPVRARLCESPELWLHSSYRATAGAASAPSFLSTDWLRAQFGSDSRRAKRRYREFVQEVESSSSPFAELTGQIYLGGLAFREQIMALLDERELSGEIPVAHRRPFRPSIAQIIKDVARAYDKSPENLTMPRAPGPAREIAIYLCRDLGAHSLISIAGQFGLSYSGVSKVVGKVRTRMPSDAKLPCLRGMPASPVDDKGKVKT